MNLLILSFLVMTTLTRTFCAPAPDGGYIKDTVSKGKWDFNGNIEPKIDLGLMTLKTNVAVNAEGHNNANQTEVFRPVNGNYGYVSVGNPYNVPTGNPYGMQPFTPRGIPPNPNPYGSPLRYPYMDLTYPYFKGPQDPGPLNTPYWQPTEQGHSPPRPAPPRPASPRPASPVSVPAVPNNPPQNTPTTTTKEAPPFKTTITREVFSTTTPEATDTTMGDVDVTTRRTYAPNVQETDHVSGQQLTDYDEDALDAHDIHIDQHSVDTSPSTSASFSPQQETQYYIVKYNY